MATAGLNTIVVAVCATALLALGATSAVAAEEGAREGGPVAKPGPPPALKKRQASNAAGLALMRTLDEDSEIDSLRCKRAGRMTFSCRATGTTGGQSAEDEDFQDEEVPSAADGVDEESDGMDGAAEEWTARVRVRKVCRRTAEGQSWACRVKTKIRFERDLDEEGAADEDQSRDQVREPGPSGEGTGDGDRAAMPAESHRSNEGREQVV